ncbi:MAG: hypothetical protein SNH55_02330 [Rikenellaceae bacterium]
MKKILFIFQIFVVGVIFTSCEKPIPTADGVEMTPVYHIYHPSYLTESSYVASDAYDIYVYREYSRLVQYSGANYTGVSIYGLEDYQDNSDADTWDISFCRVADDGTRTYYDIYGSTDYYIDYDEPTYDGNTPTFNYTREELVMTITTADGTSTEYTDVRVSEWELAIESALLDAE